MKVVKCVLFVVIGLAATSPAVARIFIPRGQSLSSSGGTGAPSQTSEHEITLSGASPGPEEAPAGGFLDEDVLQHPQASMTVGQGTPVVTQAGSLLQLQSKNEEAEPEEPEETAESATSSGQSTEDKAKASSSEVAESASSSEDAKSSNGQPNKGDTAKETTSEASKESENANASKTEVEKPEATESKKEVPEEAASKHHSEHEKESAQGRENEERAAKDERKEEVRVEGSLTHEPSDFESLLARLRLLLSASKGKELFDRLLAVVDLHEKATQAERELEKEATKAEAKPSTEEQTTADRAVQRDLLLSQQLSNMWVLPLHEDSKRQTCLSGFEKMTHEGTITCADPQCFKLETQAAQCPYMPIVSVMRKEDLDSLKGSSPGGQASAHPKAHRDHILLGFDGECKQPENLGTEILTMLQRPKNIAMKHALERMTGSGGTVSLQKHHLDLICDPETKSEYPACKTVYEALQHFTKTEPRALPELLVLTNIQDLKDTLGLYRITFLFEGLVQFATPDGTKIDASQHKLATAKSEFVHRHRHEDISATVLLNQD